MTSLKAYWAAMSHSDQDTYIQGARGSQHNNLLGQPETMTGYKLFYTINWIRSLSSYTPYNTYHGVGLSYVSTNTTYYSNNSGAPGLQLFDNDATGLGGMILFYMRACYSPEDSYTGNPFKYTGTRAIPGAGFSFDISSSYGSHFGFDYQPGQISELFWCYCDPVYGNVSRAVYCSSVIQ